MYFSEENKKEINEFLRIVKENEENKKRLFSNILLDYFKSKYKNKIGIIINENSYKVIFPKNFDGDNHEIEDEIAAFFMTIFNLVKNELIYFVEVCGNYSDEFAFLKTDNSTPRLLELGERFPPKKFLEYIYSKCYISPELYDLKNRNYNSIELSNLNLTRMALWGTIASNILTIFAMLWIAYKVHVTVFFENKQFNELTSSKQINVKNENNIIISEDFYKPKIKLKLEIFK